LQVNFTKSPTLGEHKRPLSKTFKHLTEPKLLNDGVTIVTNSVFIHDIIIDKTNNN